MRASIACLVVGALLLAAGTSAHAQQHNAKIPPEPPPPQYRVPEPTRPMALSRVAINVPHRAVVGKIFTDALCGLQEFPVYSENAYGGARTKDFADVFAAEARAAGYRLGEGQDTLFETSDGAQTEIAVGAAILELAVRGCGGVSVLRGARQGSMDATVKVDWQVFDPLDKKILFRATTSGSAKVKGDPKYITVEAARTAFQDAARQVLADPAFFAAVRDTRPQVPEASNSLFPEAATAPPAPIPSIALRPRSTKRFEDQIPELESQVVTIKQASGSGSGFFIAPDLLLTNEHVVRGARTVKVRFLDKREIEGTVLKSDAPRDIALVRMEPSDAAGLPLRLDPPPVGSRVFVIGSPLGEGLAGSVTSGIVSAWRDFRAKKPSDLHGKFIQSDVTVNHGNSGGPMFDDMGNVIGLTDIGLPGQDGKAVGLNLFIPIADGLEKLGVEVAPAETPTKVGRAGK
jgi:S1-C subfamily serine protease